MKYIHVLTKEEAREFDPGQLSTLMIRIGGGEGDDITSPLIYGGMKERWYEFQDIDTYRGEEIDEGGFTISRPVARRIISDTKDLVKGLEQIAVHCQSGWSRSPAVALSLNEAFELGVDPYSFFDPGKHCPNITVYREILQAAKDLGILNNPKYRHLSELEKIRR